MGIVLEANFKAKLKSQLYQFNPKDHRPEYHAEIFSELFSRFPQFKAHVAAYVERNYCFVVNDEDHPNPESLLTILKPQEIRMLNDWIDLKNHRASIIKNLRSPAHSRGSK